MNISVAEPVSLAMGRSGKVLFRPFDLGKWMTLGFCAWLANLGSEGANFGARMRFGGAPAPAPVVPGPPGNAPPGAAANGNAQFQQMAQNALS